MMQTKLTMEGSEIIQTRSLTLNEITKLPTVKLTEDFTCLEGWVVKDVLWEGVPISEIIDREDLKPSAKSLVFCSGGYTVRLDLEIAFKRSTIIALKKWGVILDRSSGGPLRLVFGGHDCYESVKSVDRILVCSDVKEGTAKNIAMDRFGKGTQ